MNDQVTSQFEEFQSNELEKFDTYEDYLDDKIEPNDVMYLGNIDLARQLIELGIRSTQPILKKEQFEAKKRALEEAKKNLNNDKVKELTHKIVPEDKWKDDPLLVEIAKHEEEVINGKMMVIVFIRAVKRKPKSTIDLKKVKMVESKYDKHDIRYLKKQQNKEIEEENRRNKESEDKEEIQLKELEEEGVEISGYIDLAHRLKTKDFTQYFKGQKLFLPKNTDLSYYNWNTGVCVSNDSPNFKVDASSGTKGLLFRNKRDRKVINVDPEQTDTNESTKRETVVSKFPEYKQIAFFIHQTRRKA